MGKEGKEKRGKKKGSVSAAPTEKKEGGRGGREGGREGSTFPCQVGEFVHVNVDLDVILASVVLSRVLDQDGLAVALEEGRREGGVKGGMFNNRKDSNDRAHHPWRSLPPSFPPSLPPSLPPFLLSTCAINDGNPSSSIFLHKQMALKRSRHSKVRGDGVAPCWGGREGGREGWREGERVRYRDRKDLHDSACH